MRRALSSIWNRLLSSLAVVSLIGCGGGAELQMDTVSVEEANVASTQQASGFAGCPFSGLAYPVAAGTTTIPNDLLLRGYVTNPIQMSTLGAPYTAPFPVGPNEPVVIRFSTVIDIPAGNYVFYINSAGSTKLYTDGTLRATGNGYFSAYGLAAGRHLVEVHTIQTTGYSIEVRYAPAITGAPNPTPANMAFLSSTVPSSDAACLTTTPGDTSPGLRGTVSVSNIVETDNSNKFSEYTMSAWFRGNGSGPIYTTTGINLQMLADGRVQFSAGAGSSTSLNSYNDWRWHRANTTVKVTPGNGSYSVERKFYIDGNLAGTAPAMSYNAKQTIATASAGSQNIEVADVKIASGLDTGSGYQGPDYPLTGGSTSAYLHWPLDDRDGTIALDVGSGQNNGTVSSSARWGLWGSSTSSGSSEGLDCLDILEKGASRGDGVYTIDPDASGPIHPFYVSCDMTTAGGGWTQVHQSYASSLGSVSATSRQYLYLDGDTGRFYQSPATTLAWSWGLGQEVTGWYRYFDGSSVSAFHCGGSVEAPAFGLGCSNGGGAVAKLLPYDSFNAGAGTANVCQDNPDAFGVGACKSGIAIFERRAISGAGQLPVGIDCLDIKTQGLSTGDGLYVINPSGTGTAGSFQVYCDMTTDGGGWTQVNVPYSQSLGAASRQYLYSSSGRWYKSPETSMSWNWEFGQELTGNYTYFDGTNYGSFACPTAYEVPHFGVGCSTGPGATAKILPAYVPDVAAGTTTICQDIPNAFGGGACQPDVAIFERRF